MVEVKLGRKRNETKRNKRSKTNHCNFSQVYKSKKLRQFIILWVNEWKNLNVCATKQTKERDAVVVLMFVIIITIILYCCEIAVAHVNKALFIVHMHTLHVFSSDFVCFFLWFSDFDTCETKYQNCVLTIIFGMNTKLHLLHSYVVTVKSACYFCLCETCHVRKSLSTSQKYGFYLKLATGSLVAFLFLSLLPFSFLYLCRMCFFAPNLHGIAQEFSFAAFLIW